MLGRFRSNFKKMWFVDIKRASRPFDSFKLDLMGHRWSKLWLFENISTNEILMLIFDLP
jgi:hypothetical protein